MMSDGTVAHCHVFLFFLKNLQIEKKVCQELTMLIICARYFLRYSTMW